MIAAVYFKIQTSKDLIDLSKECIKYGETSNKSLRSNQVKIWLDRRNFGIQQRVKIYFRLRFRLKLFYYFDHDFRYMYSILIIQDAMKRGLKDLQYFY